MADRCIKFRRLRKILRKFGVDWSPRRGKGSHGSFFKHMDGGWLSYPVPDETDVLICYVRGCRKKFKPTAEDGVSDDEFYNS
jgi:predicted RNA binding protein YcfA (HicA-like mRNA interferase family)